MNFVSDALADGVPIAAQRLGISKSQAWLEIREGRLRARKAGGRTLVSREDQKAWLEALPERAA